MQNRILKSIMIMSLCLSYSSAEEQTGLLATVKSFFGATSPAERDRGEGTSRIFTPLAKKNSLNKQDNTTPATSSIPTTHDGYWKENPIQRASKHAPLMEEPGVLMSDRTLSPYPQAPTFSKNEAPSPVLPNDFIAEPTSPIKTTTQERLILQPQQPFTQQNVPLFPSDPQIATENTTPTPPFSTAPYPIPLEPGIPKPAIDEIPMMAGEEALPQQSQLSTPPHFPHDDIVDDIPGHP